MLILDDILLAPFTAPFKGLLWTAGKIKDAAEDEMESQRTRTRSELSELYMQLETGKITEDEFDEREKRLLDRLDQLKEKAPPAEPAEEEADEPAADEPAADTPAAGVPTADAPAADAPAKVERVKEEA